MPERKRFFKIEAFPKGGISGMCFVWFPQHKTWHLKFPVLSTVAPINNQLRAKARLSADNLSSIQTFNIFDRMKKMNVQKDLESHVKANLALLHLQHLHPLLLTLLLLQLLDQPLNARYCLLLIPSPCIHRLLHR